MAIFVKTLFVIVLLIGLTYAEIDESPKPRPRRQFYVCPPGFKRISNNCYYFSQHMATWQDAHYDCRDRHSELAILQTPGEDKKLRSQLNKPSVTPLEWWIGGIYDWEQMQWKWGSSGKPLIYQGFSRMAPDNKENLKWHCIILDPMMKYKWSARSCVLGKHFICQKKVDRVTERRLKKLRQKYNSTLNEIRAPIYEKPVKPRKNENFANGYPKTGLKHHTPNGVNTLDKYNAFGHRRNHTETRRGRKRDRNNRERKRNRKNKNHNFQLHVRNGTDFSLVSGESGFPMQNVPKNVRRNRRNKSKETSSAENSSLMQETNQNKIKLINENNSLESITQKTTYLENTISPLHPRLIVEEHDFEDII